MRSIPWLVSVVGCRLLWGKGKRDKSVQCGIECNWPVGIWNDWALAPLLNPTNIIIINDKQSLLAACLHGSPARPVPLHPDRWRSRTMTCGCVSPPSRQWDGGVGDFLGFSSRFSRSVFYVCISASGSSCITDTSCWLAVESGVSHISCARLPSCCIGSSSLWNMLWWSRSRKCGQSPRRGERD